LYQINEQAVLLQVICCCFIAHHFCCKGRSCSRWTR